MKQLIVDGEYLRNYFSDGGEGGDYPFLIGLLKRIATFDIDCESDDFLLLNLPSRSHRNLITEYIQQARQRISRHESLRAQQWLEIGSDFDYTHLLTSDN